MNIRTFIASFIPPIFRRATVALRSEPANISSSATVATVQSAIRAAEAGDTQQLFALYRDLTVSGSHIQCEFGKRKMAVLSQPHSILPLDKENAEDKKAAEAVTRMIQDCENWSAGVTHLLDGSLWPLAVVEKIFRPVTPEDSNAVPGMRFTLRKLNIVNPALLCFREPYGISARSEVRSANDARPSTLSPLTSEERWEPTLRFYETDQDGRILYGLEQTYLPDPARHLIYRGHLLVGVRDNWGGPMRSVVYWWLLGVLGRDWFARAMERYGSPFPVGKTDAQNADAVSFLQNAFSLSTKIGGLVVDNDTQVELIEAMTAGMADAHEKFLGICNREISKVIVGQELSSTAAATGLGSGVAKLQSDVRDDIRMFDQIALGETLTRQLFNPFLRYNGLAGKCKIVWGGLDDEEAGAVAKLLVDLKNADLEPTDEAIPVLSERVGFQIQRKAPPPAPTGTPSPPSGERAGVRGFSSSGLIRTFTAERAMAEDIGVPTSWLAPVRDHLRDIEAKIRDKSINDEDLQKFLDEAIRKMPELFGEMDKEALARIFEAGMSGATLTGLREGMKDLKNADSQSR